MSEKNATIGTSLLVFLAGAATGAILAALITPKSGSELRGDLKDLGSRVKDRLARMRSTDIEHANG